MSKYEILAQYIKNGEIVGVIRREAELEETAEMTWGIIGTQIDQMVWCDDMVKKVRGLESTARSEE